MRADKSPGCGYCSCRIFSIAIRPYFICIVLSDGSASNKDLDRIAKTGSDR